MRKVVKVREDAGEFFLELSDFAEHVDIAAVDSYEIEECVDKLIIRFYDKDGKPVCASTGS